MRALKTGGDVLNGSSRFLSLAELKAAHGDLLRRHREAASNASLDKAAFDASLEEINDLMLRARSTGVLLGSDADREVAQGLVDYWTTVLSRAGREVEDVTVEEYDPGLAPELPDELFPYAGADAVDGSQGEGLFGRKRLIEAGLARLRAGRLLAVVGAGGAGKSSLVHGGVLPALQAGALPGSRQWRYLRPISPGSLPLQALAQLVPDAASEAAAEFARRPGSLAKLLSESGGEPAVIVVDRFEEVFFLCQDDAARRMFIENLLGAVRAPGPGHLVILALREEFADRVARTPSMHTLFTKAQLSITPPNAAELREAVEGPAERIGLKFSDGVVDALIQDLVGEPEAFALLQFTLRELWDRRERNRISMETLRKVGGGRQAVVQSAEALYKQLNDADREECKRVLLQLARPQAGSASGNGVSAVSARVVAHRDLAVPDRQDATHRILDRLVKARLVRRIRGDRPEDDQFEMVHDALVRNWPRMIEWLADNRMSMVALRRLEDRAAEWIALGRNGGLFDELELREAERWLASPEASEVGVSESVRSFTQASREAITAAAAAREAARTRELQQTLALADEQTKRAQAEALSTRRRAALRIGALSALMLLTIVTMFFRAALDKKQRALVNKQRDLVQKELEATKARVELEEQQAISERSQKLAFQSVSMRDDRLDVALLLAEQAYSLREENFDARSSILEGLQRSPRLVRYLWHPEGLKGPSASATSIAVSHDGRWMASSYANGSVRLWSRPSSLGAPRSSSDSPAPSEREGFWLSLGPEKSPVGRDRVSRLAFSPDGRYLASAGRRGKIRIWTLPEDASPPGEPIELRPVHDREVKGLAFRPISGHQSEARKLPDGATCLVSADAGGAVVLWRWDSKGPSKSAFHRLTYDRDSREEQRAINSVAFSPDGQKLVAGCQDAAVYVWSLGDEGWLTTEMNVGPPDCLRGHREAVTSVAFSPDGQTLASGGEDNAVNLWGFDARGGTRLGWRPLVGHTDDVTDLAFSPDGGLLASAGADEVVVLWEVPARAALHHGKLSGHSEVVEGLAFTPDGRFLASCGADSAIILWDVEEPDVEPPLGEILVTRSTGVRAVAVRPDGELLASAGDSGSIQLWNRQARRDGARTAAKAAHRAPVTSLAFVPDAGRGTADPRSGLLASGAEDGTIALWDTGDPKSADLVKLSEIVTKPAESRSTLGVTDLTFSPDRRILAASFGLKQEKPQDGVIRFWEVSDPNSPRELPELPRVEGQGSIWGLDFRHDGKALAYGADDGKIYLCEGEDLDKTIRQTPNPLPELHKLGVHAVAFNPAGDLLASGGWDGTVLLWDFRSPEKARKHSLIFHRGDVRSVVFSPDGQTLASGSIDENVILWNVEAALDDQGRQAMKGGRPLIGHSDGVRSLAFLSAGGGDPLLLASGSWDSTVMLWDVDMTKLAPYAPPLFDKKSNVIESLDSSADGRWLATDELMDGVSVYRVGKGAGAPPGESTRPAPLFLNDPSRPRSIRDVAFSRHGDPDSGMLAAGGAEGAVLLWERGPEGEWKSRGEFKIPAEGRRYLVNTVAFNPTGDLLAAGWNDGEVTILDVATLSSIGDPISAHDDEVNAVAFSPDGKFLVSCGMDGAVRRWTIRGERLSDLHEPASNRARAVSVYCVEFDPSGRMIACGCEDGTILIWNRNEDGEYQAIDAPIKAHRDEVFDLAFSPDGTLLASAGGDRVVRLWDVATRRPLGLPLVHHRLDVTGVAFCRGGKALASCSEDGTIVLWDVDVESWLKRIHWIVGRGLDSDELNLFMPKDKATDGRTAAAR